MLDAEGGESYIYNKATEKSIPIRQENNVYVLDVDEPDDTVGEPFAGRCK